MKQPINTLQEAKGWNRVMSKEERDLAILKTRIVALGALTMVLDCVINQQTAIVCRRVWGR